MKLSENLIKNLTILIEKEIKINNIKLKQLDIEKLNNDLEKQKHLDLLNEEDENYENKMEDIFNFSNEIISRIENKYQKIIQSNIEFNDFIEKQLKTQ